ncbi:hypothetical protein CO165_03110 [Candidatus Roizmanbacteria bacterium CG_4_9_14_3_um_filter_33_18]|uniref:Uncharacterized protein n=2 Tax=Candidatus Roizmaniibacteriota TaxID=1752723 RepID=A0A2M7XXS2_9BACT|nr:MAG: hypothetical protein COW97_02955 [Candidatus Roizmanbacteria bacterium CG22_combo_CG10-13_8_21_14_all_34_12]PJA55526.1 MAG: hypothetical protein CO165_03110 [Candidatus Roizmanbacteria bacterium CG_4_9_14_3_um_filter_33_18]
MSANTIIILEKVKDGFQISFKDVESSGNFDKKIFGDLQNALKYAKEIQDSGDVEYGLYIKSL